MPMPDETSRLDENTLDRLFPWLRLFRSLRVAIDAKKLILAMLGLLVFEAGQEGLARLFPRPEPVVASPRGLELLRGAAGPQLLEPPSPVFPADRASVLADLGSAPWRLTEPVRYLVGPYLRIFALENDWRGLLDALLSAVWATAVWGIVGGAITRIAVVQLARNQRIGIGEAVRFAGRKWLPLVGTPLCPLLGVAFFTFVCAGLGLLYRVPGLGPTLAGVFAVFPLLAGVVMTIVLYSLAAGWPLMHATVAADGEDGFDALSRSFAYVNQRPLRYASLGLLVWALGIIGLTFVDLFARSSVHMAHWALGFGAPRDVLNTLFQGGDAPVAGSARTIHTAWLSLVGLAAHGWIYSYFWTCAAGIYLLLRQDVDGTPWHAIVPPEPRAFEFERESSREPTTAEGPVTAEPAPAAPGATVVSDASAPS